ncbi:MAG: hypothetical protein QF704_17405, partial [Anaerolineales bacterium]|nr:hypothetical protein [Anaerolineales bacterium]
MAKKAIIDIKNVVIQASIVLRTIKAIIMKPTNYPSLIKNQFSELQSNTITQSWFILSRLWRFKTNTEFSRFCEIVIWYSSSSGQLDKGYLNEWNRAA